MHISTPASMTYCKRFTPIGLYDDTPVRNNDLVILTYCLDKPTPEYDSTPFNQIIELIAVLHGQYCRIDEGDHIRIGSGGVNLGLPTKP